MTSDYSVTEYSIGMDDHPTKPVTLTKTTLNWRGTSSRVIGRFTDAQLAGIAKREAEGMPEEAMHE